MKTLLAAAMAFAIASSPVAGIHPLSATASTGEDITGHIVIEQGVDEQNVLGKKASELISADDGYKIVDVFDCYYVDDAGEKTELPYDSVTITISYASDETDSVLILHYENGKWIPVGEADSTSTATFTVSNLSPFAIAKKSAEKSPQTGDGASIAVLGGASLCAIGGVAAFGKSRKETDISN